LRARTRKLSWYISWTVAYLIIAAIILGFILSLPVWRLKSLEVKGNSFISAGKILSTAKIPVDENIFMVDLDEIKARFARIVQIKELRIKRKLPDKIVIQIIERKPFAVIMIGSLPVLVDEEGYIIAKKDIETSIYHLAIAEFPVIRGISVKSFENGVRLGEQEREFIKNSIKLLSKYFSSGGLQIEMSKKDDIEVYVEDVLRVKIGDTGNMEKKVKTLNALLKPIEGKWNKVIYIDIRIPENPVIRFK